MAANASHENQPALDLEEEQDNEQDKINTPFDPKQVDIVPRKFTISSLLERLTHGELNLSPDFQRRANLWDEKRKSRLIESILLRIPLPSFYFKEDDDGNFSVVDGLQRLCAIFHFVKYSELNKATSTKPTLNPLRLTELQYLKDLNGKEFSELERQFQRRINELEIEANVIRSTTPKEVMFNVFARLNQGGLPLSAQEIRNAIYPGVWQGKIRDIASSDHFLKATDGKIPTDRQQDMEMILRFFALYALEPKGERPSDQILDKFLNDTVENRLGKWSSSNWIKAEKDFFRALKAAIDIFEEHAFRKSHAPASRTPVNKGIFESQLLVISLFENSDIKKLIQSKEKVSQLFGTMIDEPASPLSRALRSGTGHAESSNVRIQEFKKIFKEVLNA